ncbi:MAG TPA: hypothetical protein VE861_08935, partial [Gemmatimonadaceae bacterium]|nr:hypothetical protein [Gemmatimonadaceae bacterium]
DHVRDFIHRGAMSQSPTNLSTTSAALFLTRWITHFCAPVFMFTAGLGAALWLQGGGTRRQLARYLVARGAWLMLLEVTVMRLAYNFTPSMQYPVLLLVLWVLGLCMIGLAALLWIPVPVLATLSVVVIAAHNLLDGISAAQFGGAAWLWNVVHQVGLFKVGPVLVIVGYPLVPWLAVMTLGFCSARLFTLTPEVRQRRLLQLGTAATVAFVTVRLLDGYGDPVPWTVQASSTFTFLSFLNTSKYPPSLLFLLMTLGPSLIVLAALDRRGVASDTPLVVFGRVPLFYFVGHFFLAHLAAVLMAWMRYGSAAAAFTFMPVPSMGGEKTSYPPDYGYDLWVAYAVWIAIVLLMYPACRWYGGVKATQRHWWLRYL